MLGKKMQRWQKRQSNGDEVSITRKCSSRHREKSMDVVGFHPSLSSNETPHPWMSPPRLLGLRWQLPVPAVKQN